MAEKHYRHTQIGYWISSLTALVFAGIAMVLFLRDAPWASSAGLLVVGLITLLTFSKLTVVVDAQGVHFWFGWGWPRKSFALGEVKDVGIVHTSIWEGWGIHWHPSREWTFNVAGSHAVELTMRNRRRYRIGTDEPQRLELAINRALKRT